MFDFKKLFVLDMANNHQGLVEHGCEIIKQNAAVVKKNGLRAAIKFQFRQLESFVHPDHREQSENKHINRFWATNLEHHHYETMLSQVRDCGLLGMCTPFDEESVDIITDMGFDLMKVASCSARDWPLLEKVAAAGLPTVISTGGLILKNIDELVSFCTHRGMDFALMHCVSIYPTPDEKCNLSQIDVLRERYKDCVIGWSTHENPKDCSPIQIAQAKGAEMFERHIGLETKEIELNAYSSTPNQVDAWMQAYKKGFALCGDRERKPDLLEIESLNSLKRGVFAKKKIGRGQILKREQVFFAMPYAEGQLDSGSWNENIAALDDFAQNQPIMIEEIKRPFDPSSQVLKEATHQAKAMLTIAKIELSSEFEVEFSHHYGIENFLTTGAIIINCINRSYCKKIIIQLPGQSHPSHFHKRKEESFQILSGTLVVSLEGKIRTMTAGETCLIQEGVWHSFSSESGCIFEEVSTTHYDDDSFYKDKKIDRLARKDRKTLVDNWGRFEKKAV